MERQSSRARLSEREEREWKRRREALDLLLEAREKLLAQMTEDVLSCREDILARPGAEGFSTFELEEIEDRYSARLNALNSLIENLEYRQPAIRHRVETLTTSVRSLERDLNAFLARLEQWDLVNVGLVKIDGDRLLVTVALTADEYPE